MSKNGNKAAKKFHPCADIFPLLAGADFAALVEDIKEHGLHEPILLHDDGRIIDGRNRYRACIEAGIEPRYEAWHGDGSPLAFVLSMNLHRRHLNESQRGMIAVRIANMDHGGDRKSAKIKLPIGDLKISRKQAADMLNVGKRTVDRAGKVIECGVPELIQKVDEGQIPVHLAAGIARREPDFQKDVIRKSDMENLKPAEAMVKLKAEGLFAYTGEEWFRHSCPNIEGRPIKVYKKNDQPLWCVLLGPNQAGIDDDQHEAELLKDEVYVGWQEEIDGKKAEIEGVRKQIKELEKQAKKLEEDLRTDKRAMEKSLRDELAEEYGPARPYMRTIDYEISEGLQNELLAMNRESIAKVLLNGDDRAVIVEEGIWSDMKFWDFSSDEHFPGKVSEKYWMKWGNEPGFPQETSEEAGKEEPTDEEVNRQLGLYRNYLIDEHGWDPEVAQYHIEWLDRFYFSPDAWLGAKGKGWRKSYNLREPGEELLVGWGKYKQEHATEKASVAVYEPQAMRA